MELERLLHVLLYLITKGLAKSIRTSKHMPFKTSPNSLLELSRIKIIREIFIYDNIPKETKLCLFVKVNEIFTENKLFDYSVYSSLLSNPDFQLLFSSLEESSKKIDQKKILSKVLGVIISYEFLIDYTNEKEKLFRQELLCIEDGCYKETLKKFVKREKYIEFWDDMYDNLLYKIEKGTLLENKPKLPLSQA